MTLGEGILPGRSRGDEDLAYSQAFHPPYEPVAVDGIPIAEQVLGRGLVREALDQLVGGPGGGGVVDNVDLDELSTGMSKDQESKSKWKVRVGTKKSMATISSICAPRKVRHVEDGRGERRRMYLVMVSSATS